MLHEPAAPVSWIGFMAMCQPCLPPDLPEGINDEEKRELERGLTLLAAMIEVVRRARLSAQDIPSQRNDRHD